MSTQLHTTALAVPVPIGAVEVIMAGRRTINVLQTNTDLKVWSLYFIMKSLSVPGIFHHYTGQKATLAKIFQCSAKTIGRHIDRMQALKLCTIEDGDRLVLTGFKEACMYLGIKWRGTIKISYDYTKETGNQFFRHIVGAEDIRYRQELQRNALMNKLVKNPALKVHLDSILLQFGADGARMSNPRYYQERLLELQMQTFKEGSEVYTFIMQFRADVNRSVKRIKAHHQCKSTGTVTYWKRSLAKAGIIEVRSRYMTSTCRSRLFYVDDDGKRQEAYKWMSKIEDTRLYLPHQITTLHQVLPAATAAAAPPKRAVA